MRSGILLALAGAVFAAAGCSSSKTPSSPSPTLTAAMVAGSLGAEINTSFKAAMNAGARGGEFLATCSRGGNIRITNVPAASGGSYALSNATATLTACAHAFNGSDVLASGPLTANGSWSAAAPDSPVRLAGDLNVPSLGVVTVIGTTGASFNGTIGAVAVGSPTSTTTTAASTTTTVPATTTTTTAGPTTTTVSGGGGVNVGGTWTAPGQPGTLTIVQNGSALTCTLNGLPAGTTQNSCAGTINGSAVNITQTMTTVAVSAPYTITCNYNNALAATATSTSMIGSITTSGSCAVTGPAPLPAAPAVPTGTVPVVFVKQ